MESPLVGAGVQTERYELPCTRTRLRVERRLLQPGNQGVGVCGLVWTPFFGGDCGHGTSIAAPIASRSGPATMRRPTGHHALFSSTPLVPAGPRYHTSFLPSVPWNIKRRRSTGEASGTRAQHEGRCERLHVNHEDSKARRGRDGRPRTADRLFHGESPTKKRMVKKWQVLPAMTNMCQTPWKKGYLSS